MSIEVKGESPLGRGKGRGVGKPKADDDDNKQQILPDDSSSSSAEDNTKGENRCTQCTMMLIYFTV